MYEKYYNLKQNPFSLTADPQFVCMTAQHREALSGLIYGVFTRPGLTLLVGEVGVGKTTLLYTLLELLHKRRYVTGICNNPLLNREEFFDYLLKELEISCASSLKSQQLIALQESLMRNLASGRPSFLIVDEAQKLSLDLLEEIRLLTNLETPKQKLIHIIMAGQPELLALFRQPELRQLKQRISYFCKLKPLSLPEVREYLHHRLACAGLPNQTLFSNSCIQLVYDYTGGIPRLINTLCDNSLRTGFAMQSPEINPSIIQESAADLDLFPPVVPHDSSKANPRPVAVTAGPQLMKLYPEPERVAGGNGNSGYPTQPVRMPLEGYSARQKSLGFLAGLLDRWR